MRALHPIRLIAVLTLFLGLFTLLTVANTTELAAQTSTAMATVTTADSIALLYGLEAALDSRDEEGVVSLFTADARISDGAVYLGRERVRSWARDALADDVWLELLDAPDIGPTSGQPLAGDWAVAPVTISGRHYRELGVDPLRGVLAAVVQDARIGYLSVRPDMLWLRDLQKARAALLVPCPGCAQ